MLKAIFGIGLLLVVLQCSPGQIRPGDDSNAFRYYSRSLEAFGEKDYGQALDFINKAIAINDHIAGYYELKGDILSGQKKTDQALRAYRAALQYRSNYLGVQVKIARIYFDKKAFIKARRAYKKAIALAPEKIDLLLPLASCFLRSGEYGVTRNVLADYKRLNGEAPADTSYFILMAKTAFETKAYGKVVNMARQAINNGVRQRTLFLVYLRALFYTHKMEKAYEILVHTAKPFLLKSDVHFFRGLYFARQHNRKDAMVQLRLAVEGGTTIYEAYDLLAGFLDGKKADAIRAKGQKWKNGRLILGGLEK